MKVDLEQGKSLVGPGNLDSDTSGQVWFDYTGKDYPSKIDWKKATTLTFTPSMGKKQTFSASETEYFFTSGWVGPRLVLKRG